MSKTSNSLLNISISLISQVINVILRFISRYFFIMALGKMYLGLNSLFSNVLSVLSLAELGFGSAIIFFLFKPVSDNDTVQISKIMNLYGKIYKIISLSILAIGLLISPFIKYFINTSDPVVSVIGNNGLRLYFILFLCNTVISYFLSYKKTLLLADEKKYVITLINNILFIILNILQIIVLVVLKNYTLYLILMIAFTFIENLIIFFIADKKYPFLKQNKDKKLDKNEIKNIFKNVKAMMLHRIGHISNSAALSIILSAFISVIYTGIYSNYLMIIAAINLLFDQIFESVISSIGKFNAEKGNENSYKIFKPLLFFNFWFTGFCSVCLLILFNHFISLWVGADYTFNFLIVIMITINFYLNGTRKSLLVFRDAMGLFWYDRYKPVFEVVMGIGFSIGFSYLWGIFGVIFGYTLATFLACFYIEPYVVYKYGFKQPVKKYFIKYFAYTVIIIITFLITYLICSFFKEITWLNLFIKLFICLVIPNSIFMLLSFKTDEFKFFVSKFKVIMNGIKIKLKAKGESKT